MKPSFATIVSGAIRAVENVLHPRVLWLAALGVALLVSLVSSLVQLPGRPATLWFPAHKGSGSIAELRYLRRSPSGRSPEAQLVEELILGPMSSRSLPISVPNARADLVKRGRAALYVDLSTDILFGRETAAGVYEPPVLDPARALAYVRKSIGWNFPHKPLVLTIGGREPEWVVQAQALSKEATDASQKPTEKE